jgi:hypothetical protein
LVVDTEIVEVDAPIPPPNPTNPAEFGPCCRCGRVHRARVVSIEED